MKNQTKNVLYSFGYLFFVAILICLVFLYKSSVDRQLMISGWEGYDVAFEEQLGMTLTECVEKYDNKTRVELVCKVDKSELTVEAPVLSLAKTEADVRALGTEYFFRFTVDLTELSDVQMKFLNRLDDHFGGGEDALRKFVRPKDFLDKEIRIPLGIWREGSDYVVWPYASGERPKDVSGSLIHTYMMPVRIYHVNRGKLVFSTDSFVASEHRDLMGKYVDGKCVLFVGEINHE